ncbi:hypothetical protein MKX08_005865 [Trichoderma sp. CBMAI-0020]|nr:hypothetical protein MKX08_005865 [Trichoderma sp. CBMAI-0020]WOD45466.1 hypothetical protein [Trichoderma atroviride]
MDGTSTGKEYGDKVLAALIKGSWGFVVGGLGYGAVLIQGQADSNQPIYELQNQLPPDLEHGVGALKKRSADQGCPNHNSMFNRFYRVQFHLGAHIGAKLSGAAGENGAPRIQFYTIEDGSKANIMGGAIVYETRATDTCPEYIAFDGCEE